MSCVLRKSTFFKRENRHSTCEADQCLCFATQIVQFLFFLDLKFSASSDLLLSLYSSVCVITVWKPHESHDAVKMMHIHVYLILGGILTLVQLDHKLISSSVYSASQNCFENG